VIGVALDVQELVAFGVRDLAAADAAKRADRDGLGGAIGLQRRAGGTGSTRRDRSARDRCGGPQPGSFQEIAARGIVERPVRVISGSIVPGAVLLASISLADGGSPSSPMSRTQNIT
jgi:hypothetical protein